MFTKMKLAIYKGQGSIPRVTEKKCLTHCFIFAVKTSGSDGVQSFTGTISTEV